MPAVFGRKWVKTETRDGIEGSVCTKCHQFKPLTEYHPYKESKRGVRPDCKECHRASHKNYYETNRERVLEKTRAFNKTEHRRKYARAFQAKWAEKRRLELAKHPRPLFCEICGKAPPKEAHWSKLVFDHNHETGEFRGWLCSRCNRVLGLCGDEPQLLDAMAQYLNKRGHYGEGLKRAAQNWQGDERVFRKTLTQWKQARPYRKRTGPSKSDSHV